MSIENNNPNNKIYMSRESIQELRDRLEHLINEVRPQILEELAEARKQGDLSENADYDAAREKQAEVEAEISRVESILIQAEEIVAKDKNKVEISNIVTFTNLKTGEEQTIKLVSSNIEVSPFADIPAIAIDSPIGSALLGKLIGDEVKVVSPSGKFNIKINKIK